jgi:hypothetical protein
MTKHLLLAFLPLLLAACMTAPEHRAAVEGEGADRHDRVSTTTVYSESRAGVLALVLGGSGGALGGVGGDAGARSTTQRTLTIIVKFDKDARVRDFAYHASQF